MDVGTTVEKTPAKRHSSGAPCVMGTVMLAFVVVATVPSAVAQVSDLGREGMAALVNQLLGRTALLGLLGCGLWLVTRSRRCDEEPAWVRRLICAACAIVFATTTVASLAGPALDLMHIDDPVTQEAEVTSVAADALGDFGTTYAIELTDEDGVVMQLSVTSEHYREARVLLADNATCTAQVSYLPHTGIVMDLSLGA